MYILILHHGSERINASHRRHTSNVCYRCSQRNLFFSKHLAIDMRSVGILNTAWEFGEETFSYSPHLCISQFQTTFYSNYFPMSTNQAIACKERQLTISVVSLSNYIHGLSVHLGLTIFMIEKISHAPGNFILSLPKVKCLISLENVIWWMFL